ncbi:hypothetical protein FOB19_00005, partial [Acinetobacter lwoffii]
MSICIGASGSYKPPSGFWPHPCQVSFYALHLVCDQQYRSREQRKTETVFSFSRLHPYEQLAVIWLLNAAQDQRDFI